MVEITERLWDYDAVEPGQAAQPTVVTITAEQIAEYAEIAQNPDPRYRLGNGSDEYVGSPVPMPTMAVSYAPLLRPEIAENNGFIALEHSKTARRQTPFAKCEARWFRPALVGDTITGVGRVLEKYERRGSKFVTFRIEAKNQRGEPVGRYDYTCIFQYAHGQRSVPRDEVTAELPRSETPDLKPAPSSLLTFDSVRVEDPLAELAITESQEIINRKSEFRLAGKPSESNIHNDEEFARQNIFGGTVNAGPATMSYVDQMLQLSFPLKAFYNGGSLLMRAITPFRSGDTVTFGGEITGKREEGGQGLVECRVRGINQRGELVCLADAVMVFGE
ncbi:MAG: MaoC family dehydratase [Chloroflexi bacterium]|nr:MaoC family dehydratase [Chloroflexota bacterium]